MPLGVIHTLSGSAQPRGAPPRDLVPPPVSAIPRFARVRKLTSVDLTADLAVKNLLDGTVIDSSGRFTGAFEQEKCFSLLDCLPCTSSDTSPPYHSLPILLLVPLVSAKG